MTTLRPPTAPSAIKKIDILLVENHSLFREGLAHVLSSQPDLQISGEAGTVAEAVECARRLKPHLILMDLGLPDGSGVEAIRAIRAEQPDILIICLTVNEDDDTIMSAVRAGAQGYMFKSTRTADLLRTIRGVAQGEAGLSRGLTRRVLDRLVDQPGKSLRIEGLDAHGITPRESELIALMARGATNREIADHFVISEHTVRNHVHNVLRKLGLHSRRDVAALARAEQLLSSIALTAPIHLAVHARLWTVLSHWLAHIR